MYVLHHFFGFALMQIYMIFCLSILFGQTVTIVKSDTAACFLSVRPERGLLDIAEELAFDGLQYGVDVFVIVDDNAFTVPSTNSSNLQFLQIPNEKCIAYGYEQTMYLWFRPIQISAWDKAFLYFGELNTNYSFVWLIEEDTFIPSIQAFRSVHQLYSHTSDFVTPPIEPNPRGDISGWMNWDQAFGKLLPPWYHSMTNAMGLSRRLLATIAEHVRWRGISTFHEFFPHILSRNLNMTVVSPTEFNTLVCMADYTWNNIDDRSSNWWHPVKNWTMQKEWHDRSV